MEHDAKVIDNAAHELHKLDCSYMGDEPTPWSEMDTDKQDTLRGRAENLATAYKNNDSSVNRTTGYLTANYLMDNLHQLPQGKEIAAIIRQQVVCVSFQLSLKGEMK